MKKSLLIKRIVTLIFSLFVIWQLGSGQTLLVENFEYPAGDLPVSPSSAWVSANTGNAVQVTSGSLSYTGYLPGTGNSIALATGLDYKNQFSSITSGSVYAAFLINVTSSTAAGDYFFHFLESSSSTYYKGRIWIKTGSSASKFYIGVAKSGTTPAVAYSANEFDAGTTYLLVLKYQINASTGDDVVTLYVNPDPISAEPASPTVTAADNSTTDATSITLAGLRQASANAPYLTLDGLRVATSWTDAISDITAPAPTFVPANSATDVATSVTPAITFDEAVVKADGSELTDGDLATLVTFKKTDASGDNVSFTATIDAAKKIITVTPAASLDNSQIYYLAVGPVKDAYGNLSTTSAITFTTIGAASPTVTLTNPVGGETFYATDPVTFTWTSENVTNVLLEVFVPLANEWQSMGVAIPAVAGKLDFVIPADAPYGSEYKIRISDASNSSVNSTSGSFTVIAVASSLTDLRTNCIPNDIVKISSEVTVTYMRTNRNQKYIQDSGKGLLIDDGAHVLTTTLAPGDNITGLEGKLGLYHGMLQLVPTKATVAIASSGNIVTPTPMTIADYNTNYLNYESCKLSFRTQ